MTEHERNLLWAACYEHKPTTKQQLRDWLRGRK